MVDQLIYDYRERETLNILLNKKLFIHNHNSDNINRICDLDIVMNMRQINYESVKYRYIHVHIQEFILVYHSKGTNIYI